MEDNEKFVFADLEASSLMKGSFPIEVGWVGPDTPGVSHLIRPAPGWTEWSPRSEAIHGISLARLLAEGLPHEEVAAAAAEAFRDVTVYVSAPSFDGGWLRRLFEAAGRPWNLKIENSDKAFIRACWPLQRVIDDLPPGPNFHMERGALLDRRDDIIGRAFEAAEDLGKPAHRALDDAERLMFIFRHAENACRLEAARLTGALPGQSSP